MRTFYFCHGTNPICCNCGGCFTHGGDCKHTTNPVYARTEECKDPWNHPERFDEEKVSGFPSYYFEKETNSNDCESESETEAV